MILSEIFKRKKDNVSYLLNNMLYFSTGLKHDFHEKRSFYFYIETFPKVLEQCNHGQESHRIESFGDECLRKKETPSKSLISGNP